MRTLFTTCLLLLTTIVYAIDESMTIQVEKDQKHFVVALPSNPTTGYQWVVKNYDKSLFKLASSHYFAPKGQLIGEGGQMAFTFQIIGVVAKPQSSLIELSYERSWEQGKGTLKQVTVNLQ